MMTKGLVYFKGRWPEETVPKGEPCWTYYEVAVARDIVTRLVELLSDGHAVRNSIELTEREGDDQRGPEYRSLVHGPFLAFSRENLNPVSEGEFCLLWDSATDKPWPPENSRA